jgi:hypothetical protein
MCAPSSSLTLLIWGACGFEPLISRAVAGWQLCASDFFASAWLEGSRVGSDHESLISNSHVSRAPVAPALPRGLRGHWSVFAPSEGRYCRALRSGRSRVALTW